MKKHYAASAVLILSAIAGFILGSIFFPVQTATPAPTPTSTVDLPPCEYEDSDNCFWDAQSRGNGEGTSFVVLDNIVYYPED